MSDRAAIPRKFLILAIILPIAAFLGFKLADPNSEAFGVVLLLAGVLAIPVILRWHHPLLVLTWNLPMTLYFLPGNPTAWMLVAFLSLGISILTTVMDKEKKLIQVPMLNIAMLGLVVMVLFTMKMTGGGLGLRSLGGSSIGGRKYFYILFAVVGYFAISSQRLSVDAANKYIGLFFLPSAATALSNVVYLLGPAFWFLYYLVPVEWALSQAAEDFSRDAYSLRIGRIGGFAVAGIAVVSYLLARYGIRGVFDLRKPWRAVLLAGVVVLSMYSGYRSIALLFCLTFAVQFCLEGLHRTRLLPVMIAIGVVGFAAILPFSNKLPLPIQRTLTLLPVEVHPAVRADAAGSTEWRLQMWRALAPEIPKYFWVGKGYTAGGSDHYLMEMATRMGIRESFESAIVAGDYHNGPLSLIIPFGIWGVLAFLLFVGTSLRILYLNYRHGDLAIRHINMFLFTAFLVRVIAFFFLFGAVQVDIPVLAGLIGLSVSLNGGVCRRRALVSVPAPEPAPAARTRPRRWMPIRA